MYVQLYTPLVNILKDIDRHLGPSRRMLPAVHGVIHLCIFAHVGTSTGAPAIVTPPGVGEGQHYIVLLASRCLLSRALAVAPRFTAVLSEQSEGLLHAFQQIFLHLVGTDRQQTSHHERRGRRVTANGGGGRHRVKIKSKVEAAMQKLVYDEKHDNKRKTNWKYVHHLEAAGLFGSYP